MSTRRRLLKRIGWTTSLVVLIVVVYVAGVPITDIAMRRMKIGTRDPTTQTYFRWVYAPLVYVHDHPEMPGGQLFQRYVKWCNEVFPATPEGSSQNVGE